MNEDMDKFVGGIIIIVLVCFGLMVVGKNNSDKAQAQCEAKGGQYIEPQRSSSLCVKGVIK